MIGGATALKNPIDGCRNRKWRYRNKDAEIKTRNPNRPHPQQLGPSLTVLDPVPAYLRWRAGDAEAGDMPGQPAKAPPLLRPRNSLVSFYVEGTGARFDVVPLPGS